jgi:hypothetical protein
MSTAQRSRAATVIVVFGCATVLVLLAVGAVLGRSLTFWEVFSLTGCTAAAVASFAWAFGSGVRKTEPDSGAMAVEPGFAAGFRHPEPSEAAAPAERTQTTNTRTENGVTARDGADKLVAAPGIQTLRVSETSGPIALEDTAHDGRSLRWYGRETVAHVQDFTLQSPMVYLSNGPNREDESSCIDVNLNAWKSVVDPAAPLAPYPTYAGMGPGQRFNYLQWLSRGRVGKLNDPGYGLLFFHGLERRLLVEKKDTGPIVAEVIRLHGAYSLPEPFSTC